MDDSGKRPDTDRKIVQEARDWIVRLTSGDVSETELARFKAWAEISPAHRQAFDKERIFWQQLQVLDGRSDGMPPFRTPRAGSGRRAFLIGGGTAAIAASLAVAAPRLSLLWSADFQSGIGQMSEVALPDGSVAALNTDSAIALDFRPDLRLVHLLKGEAEFRVHPSSSLFRVAALHGNSDTLDATFSVKAFDGRAIVTASEGTVGVSGSVAPQAATGATVTLRAGEQTDYFTGGQPAPAMAADIEAVLAWRSGRLIFEGQPFASAIAELGRYLPERIVLAPGVDGQQPVSAIFSTREALAAVQAIAATQGLSARRIPGVVVLIS